MPRETDQQRTARQVLYQAFTESGQTVAEFSRERGTTPWKVKHAVRKTEGERNGKHGFHQVTTAGFESPGDFTVTLQNGRELRIPTHFSEKRVRQLIEILEAC